jgi:hypothetical protein
VLVAGLLLVPAVDLGVKVALERRLGARALSLGPLGSVHVMSSQPWIVRLGADRADPRTFALALGALWCCAAVALVVASVWLPAMSSFAGLLLGGSLSHAVETAWRGRVTDYVRLRFWPACNLADVAITVGGFGVLAQAWRAMPPVW